MANNIYFKQEKMYSPTNDAQPKIYVYGLGSIGSHVVMGLSKIGFTNIIAHDFDVVEDANLPAQCYAPSVVGKPKLVAIKEMVKHMVGSETIVAVDGKIDEKTDIDIGAGTIHILAFDNIEARKIIFEKLRGFPCKLLDGRIGGFVYQKYYLVTSDAKACEAYAKTLEGVFSEDLCGEKCLWGVNTLIATKIIGDVMKNIRGNTPLYYEAGSLLGEAEIRRVNA